jgi:D-alanine-D-alanine ligase
MLLETPTLPRRVFKFPQIVKPAAQDASVGIDQGSVVQNRNELLARVQYVFERYGGPVLVEEFIPGREIQISLIQLTPDSEPVALPFSEIAFKPSEEHKFWPIYSYTAKWDETSQEFLHAPVNVGVVLEPALTERCIAIAKQVFKLLGATDFARVDTRISADGKVYVLELNPNPSITSIMLDEGLPSVGLNYNNFIARLVTKTAATLVAPRPPSSTP